MTNYPYPYSVYMDSGVGWLGRIPEHWEVRRLKNLAGLVMGQSPSSEDCSTDQIGLPFLQGCAEFGPDHPQPEQFCRAPAKVSPKGSLLVSVRAPVGRLNAADQKYGIGRGLCAIVWKSSRLSPDFGRYGMEASTCGLRMLSTGSTYDAVSVGDMASLPIIVPPLPEQVAIARFLVHADRRIRRYIRAKQKLVALLEEQKQAIIHQAVTGQIDVRSGQPYPAYKPSGVEWMDDVPAHWEVSRLGRFINLTVGFPFKSEGFTQSEHDIRLLRGVNIAPGRLRWGDLVRWPAVDMANFAEYWLACGDIVLGMDRPIIGNGIRVAIVNQFDVPSLLLQRVARIRPDCRRLTRDFAFRLLTGTGFSDYLTPIFTGVSVPHLSPDQIKEFRVAIPTLAEQEAIKEHLRLAFDNVHPAIKHAQSHIELLNEYRARLISDVVTGKLDVREDAATLPEVDPLAAKDDLDSAFDTGARLDLDEIDATLEEAEA